MFKIFEMLFISIFDIYCLHENIKDFLSYSLTSCADRNLVLNEPGHILIIMI